MESEHTHSPKRKHVCPCCGAKIPYHKFPLFQKDFVVECPDCEAELVPKRSGRNYVVIYILFSTIWCLAPQILYNDSIGSILVAFLIFLGCILMGHFLFFFFLAMTVDFVLCKE